MAFTPPSDPKKLYELVDEIDRLLPPCDDNAFQMIAYLSAEDVLQPIRDGRLVVISRGMLRTIKQALRDSV